MSVFKKVLSLFLFIILGFSCYAQVSYFAKESIPDDKLELLKKTTTLFTLQYKDYTELEKFDEAIKKAGQ